ncbi:MAG: hypothetical protein NE330_12135 [Lentisphaeraceae bacterium]|nr:hypothetical protein [Lentisphaeraceae bacterium]
MSQKEYLSQVDFAKYLSEISGKEVKKQNVAYYKTKGFLVMKPCVKITFSGDSKFVINDNILKKEFATENERIEKDGETLAKGKSVSLVDVEKSIQKLNANLDVSYTTILSGSEPSESSAHIVPENDNPESDNSSPESEGYLKSRARRESANADIAEMDAGLKAETLTHVTQVKNQAFTTAVRTREALLSIPQDFATTLAAMDDPFAIEKFLTEEIESKLRTLSDAMKNECQEEACE